MTDWGLRGKSYEKSSPNDEELLYERVVLPLFAIV